MSPFGGSDSAEGAKGSARDAVDQSKRAARDGKDEVKQWGKSVQDNVANSWENTKNWGHHTGKNVEDGINSHSNSQLVDFGHPLVNRVFDGFVRIGSIGALHSLSQDSTYRLFISDDTSKKSLENSAQNVGRDAVKWGLVAGVYSGVTYGIEEARGVHDWKNALLGGFLTGAALSLTESNPATDRVLCSAITGGALASAVEVLRKIT